MKKILVFALLLTLVSCGNEEVKDNNVVEKKVSEISGSGNIKSDTSVKYEKEVEYIDKGTYNKESTDYINLLMNDPAQLLKIDCLKYKDDETIDLCKKDKKEFIEKTGTGKDISSINKESTDFLNILMKDPAQILKIDCFKYKDIETVDLCKKIKKEFIEITGTGKDISSIK